MKLLCLILVSLSITVKGMGKKTFKSYAYVQLTLKNFLDLLCVRKQSSISIRHSGRLNTLSYYDNLDLLLQINIGSLSFIYWPNTSVTILNRIVGFLNRVQVQRVLILYFCLFFKDNQAHNVHDKDIHDHNLITKPHIR